MRRPAVLFLFVASFALIACGGDEKTTSVTTTAEAGPTPHDPGAGAEGGPYGDLTASGIGPVEVGATQDEVEAEFGEPIETQDVDFGGGGGKAPQENWLYRFPTGDVTIKFDNRTGEFAAYDVYATDLETADGVKVGDSKSQLRKRYGDDLAESPLGLDSLVLSESNPGTAESPALTFALQGGKIFTISGGDVVQPAGE